MKQAKRLLSLFLSLATILGMMAILPIQAAAAEEPEGIVYVNNTRIDYQTTKYDNPEAKLATMTKYLEKGNFELYVDDYSGETATRNTVTEEVLFSNPYDVAYSEGSPETKNEVLSQIIVKFTDTKNNSRTFTSYEYATLRNQIKVKNIKNGVRIEYTIGREEARVLVPRLIRRERFETMIMELIRQGYNDQYGENSQEAIFYITKFEAFYQLYSLEGLNAKQKNEVLNQYPICKTMDVYACDKNVKETELNRLEEVIKTFCPEYSFDEMDADHEETGYVSEDQNPPVFKMALEYSLNEDGMSVRLPTNGIRYDESLYTIEYISVLPYFGSGNSVNTGYNFFPDGGGAIFRFEDLRNNVQTTVSGKIYGTDYAYHELTGTYQKQVTMPVYGSVENQTYYLVSDSEGENTKKLSASVDTEENLRKKYSSVTEQTQTVGYFAIIEEGESLATITTCHDGSVSDYNHFTLTFNPRPKDEYNLRDSISVADNQTMTVVSERKYTGNMKIRYIMLTDSATAADAGLTGTFDTSYVGMAKAYRQYLIDKGVLQALSAENDSITDQIPLYIETFGAIKTEQQILSMPVKVMTPLTTFDEIQTMYEELSDDSVGIKNVIFKMVGYHNGGLSGQKASYYLKWENNVGGKKGFKNLLKYAEKVNESDDQYLGIFPDANFAYVQGSSLIDGFTQKKHIVRTIDDRYTSKRYYSATQQKYKSYFEMAVSPAYYAHFYQKFVKSYLKYKNVQGLSIASLGYALNSDFDEDEPYNREDNKQYTEDAFAYISGKMDSVMTDTGNAYIWKYVNHIMNLSLDSSRYLKASASVPFIGMVLHGYMQYSGEPLNMEGDVKYSLLKAIENGASPYFILSMKNTEELKDIVQYSDYYSINYKNWKERMAELYGQLNDALADVQLKEIIDHQFVEATRVLDTAEIEEILNDEIAANEEYQRNLDVILAKEALETVSGARKLSKAAEQNMINYVKMVQDFYTQSENMMSTTLPKLSKQVSEYYEYYQIMYEQYNGDFDNMTLFMAYDQYRSKLKSMVNNVANAIQLYNRAMNTLKAAQDLCAAADEAIVIVQNAEGSLPVLVTEAENNAAAARSHLASIESTVEDIRTVADSVRNTYSGEGKLVSTEDLEARLALLNASDDEGSEDDEEEVDTKYHADSSKICAVVYGNGTTEFKTFILNYNSYAVLVEYKGNHYMIPSGDYVTIYA